MGPTVPRQGPQGDEGHPPPSPALVGDGVVKNVVPTVQKGPNLPSQGSGALPVDDLQAEHPRRPALREVRIQKGRDVPGLEEVQVQPAVERQRNRRLLVIHRRPARGLQGTAPAPPPWG